MESARAGPSDPGSRVSSERASEPSTRIVLPVNRLCGSSVTSALCVRELTPGRSAALTKNTITESNSHATITATR